MRTTARRCSRILRIGALELKNSAASFWTLHRALTIGVGQPLYDFFERIMVMDENLERRANRLALLRDVQRLLGSVADLSRLPG